MISEANEVAGLFLAAVALATVLAKVWRAQKSAVIKAHEAAQVVDRIAAEFVNNHGSSMKDSIDRLEAGQLDHARQMQALYQSHAELIRRVDDTYRLFAHVIAQEDR